MIGCYSHSMYNIVGVSLRCGEDSESDSRRPNVVLPGIQDVQASRELRRWRMKATEKPNHQKQLELAGVPHIPTCGGRRPNANQLVHI